ncbi:ketopantoate reductase family protein [Falsibacillus pallidus]|uniref:2-dehydropantoate 2-reductase n=1 Tax=Falsibacillus pallidus TaxID=493781 RepID=A0A370GSC2_9BACI|nr:ketopantoate reductase family protein [Falsibacillus pallidus]RDI45404.1 ketopantoate reductase [Falsibacillus pallidus]
MKLLIVGAGAVGGYFGGRLAEKGEDVTFLVREKRKEQLKENGLTIQSTHGNIHIEPKVLVSGEEHDSFDAVFLSTKAYHLHKAVIDIKPYTNENTLIIPLLNGISHLELLENHFKKENILGGLCFIESTLDSNGGIHHTSPMHETVFGPRDGEMTESILLLNKALHGSKAEFRLSENIMQEMWHKYLFISTFSGVTSLFRSPIGPIREQPESRSIMHQLIAEVKETVIAIKAPVLNGIDEILKSKLQEIGQGMKSSLQRDMEKGQDIEAEHLFGHMKALATHHNIQTPVLDVIYANLKVYESNK